LLNGGAEGWQPLHTVCFELVDAPCGGDAKQDGSLEISEIVLDESDKAVETVCTGMQAFAVQGGSNGGTGDPSENSLHPPYLLTTFIDAAQISLCISYLYLMLRKRTTSAYFASSTVSEDT
jgi:hypothetical protein